MLVREWPGCSSRVQCIFVHVGAVMSRHHTCRQDARQRVGRSTVSTVGPLLGPGQALQQSGIRTAAGHAHRHVSWQALNLQCVQNTVLEQLQTRQERIETTAAKGPP